MVTFGAPRCIGRVNIEAYPHRVLRIVRNTDPVPLVPRLRFQHPVGSDQRVPRYQGDLATTRNLGGYLMAGVYYLNPSRCFFAQARRSHSAMAYAHDMEPHTPLGVP